LIGERRNTRGDRRRLVDCDALTHVDDLTLRITRDCDAVGIVATTDLPDDNDALKAALIEVRAKLSGAEAMIAHLQLVIAKIKRERFGPRSERSQRLLDQLELQLEELAAAAAEDEAKAETAGI
jgi:Transposase C of IS166 homeodomain